MTTPPRRDSGLLRRSSRHFRRSSRHFRRSYGHFRRSYGASPLHLLALLAGFALAGYAVTRVLAEDGPLPAIALWFVGAAVGHDALLYPLYAVADLAAHNRLRRRHQPPPAVGGVPWINHLRVPVALSGLLLLVWFPLVLGGRDAAFTDATGLHTDVYLGRWLGITGMLFLGSAVGYAVRLGRARPVGRTRRHPVAGRAPGSGTAPAPGSRTPPSPGSGPQP